MKLIFLILSFFIYLTSFSYAKDVQLNQNTYYRVQHVIDGDTFKLDNRQHVRLIGIDAPELKDDAKLQRDLVKRHIAKTVELNQGKQSKAFLKKLVEGKKVRLKFDKAKYDKYHRLLAYVYLADGRFVNAEIIKAGYAYPLTIKPNTQYDKIFKKHYSQAKDKHLGLWQKRGDHDKRVKWFVNN